MQLKVIIEYFNTWNELNAYLEDTKVLLEQHNINSESEIYTNGQRYKVKILLEL